MATFPERVTLGRSGLTVGPLGVAGGYGVETAAIRRAVDRGCTYLYHGSRREQGMTAAIRDLVAAGRRDELVVVLQSYSRWPWLLDRMVARGCARSASTMPTCCCSAGTTTYPPQHSWSGWCGFRRREPSGTSRCRPPAAGVR